MPTESPAVPEAAIVYEGDAAHVWVVQGDGLIAYRAVRTGRTNGGLVEVLDGLKAGETDRHQGRPVHRPGGGTRSP